MFKYLHVRHYLKNDFFGVFIMITRMDILHFNDKIHHSVLWIYCGDHKFKNFAKSYRSNAQFSFHIPAKMI